MSRCCILCSAAARPGPPFVPAFAARRGAGRGRRYRRQKTVSLPGEPRGDDAIFRDAFIEVAS